MSQSKPPVVIELEGPYPTRGYYYCATCVVLYMGEVSADKDIQAQAQKMVENALNEGITEVLFRLPMSWRKLRTAITIAPSVYLHYPAPVCWVHVQGAKPGGKSLLEGKADL